MRGVLAEGRIVTIHPPPSFTRRHHSPATSPSLCCRAVITVVIPVIADRVSPRATRLSPPCQHYAAVISPSRCILPPASRSGRFGAAR